MKHRHKILAILPLLLFVCSLGMQAQVTYVWKKKGGYMALVRKEKKHKDVLLTQFKYSAKCKESIYKGKPARQFSSYDGKHFVCIVKSDDGYGMLDEKGYEVVACQFASLEIKNKYMGEKSDYKGQIWVTGHNGKVGMSKCSFDKKSGFFYVNGIYKNGAFSFAEKDVCVYDKIVPLERDLRIECNHETDEFKIQRSDAYQDYIAYQNGKCGIIDTDKLWVPCRYDESSFNRIDFWDGNEDTYHKYFRHRIHANTNMYEIMVRGDSSVLYHINGEEEVFKAKGKCFPFKRIYNRDHHFYITKADPHITDGKEHEDLWTYDLTNGMAIHGNVLQNMRLLPSDRSGIYLTGHDEEDYPVTLYNAKAGRPMLGGKSYKAIKPLAGHTGFYVFSGETESKEGFITRDGSEVVLLDSAEMLPTIAETVESVGTTDILRYKGGYGLYDRNTRATLACNLDTIYSVGKTYSQSEAMFTDLFVVKHGDFIGLADSHGMFLPPLYTSILQCGPDSIRLGMDKWFYRSFHFMHRSDRFGKKIYEITVRRDKDDNFFVSADNLTTLLDCYKEKETDHEDWLHNVSIVGSLTELGMWISDPAVCGLAHYRYAMILADMQKYESAIEHCRKAVEEYGMQQWSDQLATLKQAKKEYDLYQQRQQQLRAEEIARQKQQRMEAWATFFQQLASTTQQIAQTVSNLKSKKHSTASTYRRQSAGNGTRGTQTTARTTASQRKPGNSMIMTGNRNRDQRSYDKYALLIQKMYYGTYRYDAAEVKRYQATMREMRTNWEKRGLSFFKSEWEDKVFNKK